MFGRKKEVGAVVEVEEVTYRCAMIVKGDGDYCGPLTLKDLRDLVDKTDDFSEDARVERFLFHNAIKVVEYERAV